MKTLQGLTCLAVLAVNAPTHAQEVITETTTVRTQAAQVAQAPQLRRVSQILGSSVQLQGGTAFGKVEDIVLNDAGAVEYVVASNEGRLVMLPWDAANFDVVKRVMVYDVTPQALQPLSFTRDAWPNAADAQYTTRVRKVFPRGVRRQVVPAPGLGVPTDADRVKIKEKDGKVKIKVKDRDRD